MSGEVDAEEVEDFALVEVGGGPDGGNGVDAGIVAGDAGVDADALLEAHAEDGVGDLEAGRCRSVRGIPVDSGDVFEEVVAGILGGLGGGADVLRSDGEGEFFAVPLGVEDEVLECANGDVVGQCFGDGFFAEDGVGGWRGW